MTVGPVAAQDTAGPDSLAAAVRGGTPSLELRLRVEHVDNEAPTQPRDATATTLRARLGYTTGAWRDFAAALEYEGTSAWDTRDYYDASATSSQTQRPAIADPAGSELNQAWLRWSGIPRTTLQAGRQRWALDNQRFVGNVAWRQNEQTYDGGVLASRPLPGVDFTYAYFHNANSIIFTNVPGRFHLVNVSYAPAPWLKATGYDYRLDFDTSVGNREDRETVGARLTGTPSLGESVALQYAVEYARQTDHADATSPFAADYRLGELGIAVARATLKFGYEVLGSDAGAAAVQTPLATLHAFNGWADVFLVTPSAGLADAYAHLGVTAAGLAINVVYHAFRGDEGGAEFGTELDASLGYAVGASVAALVKVARYEAETFGTDTDKAWLQVEYRF